MLQMMFDDIPQLNNGNLNLLLENENALDIATTFSVTMPQQTNYENQANIPANADGSIYATNNQYSANSVYTMADFQSSSTNQITANSVRYQPYCVQQRTNHDEQRSSLSYQSGAEYTQTTAQFTAGVNNAQTCFISDSINHPTPVSTVCQFSNYGEGNNGQPWTEQIPPSFYDQTNSNTNNNNNSLVNHTYLNSYQNNQLNEHNQNQFVCPPSFSVNNYQNPENKIFHSTVPQQNQFNSGSYNQFIAQQMNFPPSPTEPTSTQRKKPSPEPKKKNKKRKKKGMNEPQKPVSAYALFFRDTQAAIKSENPSASFGEISKIVASMWDTLSEGAKKVYKQKTETAKRDYLKQLAMFKANTISMGGDVDEEDMQPLSVLKEKMASSSASASTKPLSPIITPPQVIDLTSPDRSTTSDNPMLQLNKCDEVGEDHLEKNEVEESIPPEQEPETSLKSPPIVYKQIILSNQKGSKGTITFLSKSTTDTSQTTSMSPSTTQMKRFVLTPMSTPGSSPSDQPRPSPIHLRNIVSKSPVTFIPSKQGHIIKVLPSGKLSAVTIPKVQPGTLKGNVIKLNSLQPLTFASSPTTTTAADIPQSLFSTTTITHVETIEDANMHNDPEMVMEELPKLPPLQFRPQVEKTVPMESESPQPSSPPAPMPTLKQIPKLSKEPDMIMDDDMPIANELDDETMSSEPEIDEQPPLRKKESSPVTIMLTTEPEKPQKPKQTSLQSKPEVKKPGKQPRKLCVRNSCQKVAVSNPEWNGDYCGYDCVAKHCRDVMDAWISARQITASLG